MLKKMGPDLFYIYMEIVTLTGFDMVEDIVGEAFACVTLHDF
jgi:hypothetical protein